MTRYLDDTWADDNRWERARKELWQMEAVGGGRLAVGGWSRASDQHERVRNRQTWTVAAIDADGRLTASHPERGTVTLPADYVARHVELGWAVTGYGNQGDTVDVGLAILEPGTTRNHAYVALTRGRQVNLAWVPDATGTLDPAAQLADMIGRIPSTASALATRDRLYREAGRSQPERNRPEQARPEPISPALDAPAGPAIDERVRAMQARLDRLQQRSRGRWLSR
ncbi:MAG: hypothetical protein M3Z46_11280 [Actinomycetota bacterium]|nr:hypothetical protein [Actinomycetota bacterium]